MNPNYVNMYQAGGPMGDPAMAQGAPAPEQGAPQGGGDPTAQIQEMVAAYAQQRTPELAMQICDLLVQVMGAGGGAAQGQDPAMADPAMAQAPAGGNGMRMPYYAKGGAVNVDMMKGKKMSAIDKMKAAKKSK